MKKSVFLTALILLLIAATLSSCKKPEEAEVGSLEGTKWKFAGFVDVKTGGIRVPEPTEYTRRGREVGSIPTFSIITCYSVIFHEDGTFRTYTPTNDLNGIYGVDNETQNFFIFVTCGTKVAELLDGPLFRNSINAVQSYSLREDELKLYYNDNKNYLLFKPLNK